MHWNSEGASKSCIILILFIINILLRQWMQMDLRDEIKDPT